MSLNSNCIVGLNGKIVPASEAMISVFDRGFIYGDSLYEVLRTYRGRPFKMKEHLKRLQISAELCTMKLDQSLDEYDQQIRLCLEHFHKKMGDPEAEAYVRLVVTRGWGEIGMGRKSVSSPTQYLVYVQPLAVTTPAQLEKGLSLKVTKRIRNHPQALDPAMKSGNYLNSLLAVLEAHDDGFDDAILCNLEGFVTEGSTFNVFYCRRGVVATPPLKVGILDGITRRSVIGVMRQAGLEVREVFFPKERLFEADEVFATSTLKDVVPITAVDGKKIGNGRPGPLTQKISQLYESWLKEATQAND